MIALVFSWRFPWRWAVALSLGLLGLVALPAALLESIHGDPAWREAMQSFLVNGALMQLTFCFA